MTAPKAAARAGALVASGVVSLGERLLAGEAAALARAISAIEREDAVSIDILQRIQPHLGRARVVGFTGAPGAGKSTLVNAFIHHLRKQDKTVGVIAIDPSSPISGGAILGDRIRMGDHSVDPGVFIRSLASRGHLGGLARAAAHTIDLMDAAGRDYVILETVGVGQSEVEIAEAVDTTVVVSAPGLGDDIQAIKAGILEVADVLVVNKGDIAGADRTARQLRAMLQLRQHTAWTPPVVITTATSADGVIDLAEAVAAHGAARGETGRGRDPEQLLRRLLASAAAEKFRDRLRDGTNPLLDQLARATQAGEIPFETAVDRLLGE